MNFSSIKRDTLKGWTTADWESFQKNILNQGYNEEEIEKNIDRITNEIKLRGIDQVKEALDQEFTNPDNQPIGIEWI